MMSKASVTYRLFAILVFVLMHVASAAQDYPVNVTTVLTPPYSLYLADYASPESNSLQVIIHLRELDRPEYRVKLRVTIEGQGITLRTSPAYNPPAFVLQGGIPEMLTGHDLRHYLNPNNLDFSGISRQEFIRKGTFPEGFYTFRIEVVDYVRNVVVSNPGFANAWIILNDPPLINLPFNNEKVIATDPQNVMFNWTPMHTASPNAAFSTEYEFTLVELYPVGRNPNDAIRAANPIFVTRTQSTSLNYGVMEPLLIPGRKYAFRVKAFDTNGRDLFKNNGYSEVFVFQFGDQCVAPGNISAEAIDPDRIKLSWEGHELHTSFNAKLRKKGSTSWDEQTTYSNSIIYPGLQANTTYEYQVNGGCGTISGAYSPVAMVTTPETDPSEFVCGAPAPTIELSTTPLQGGLMIDDLIKTADFEISITEVQANADGSYKGYGVAFLPWLNFASVKVKFSNIKVNDQYRVYDGIVTTIYSKNSRFVAEIPGKAEDSPAEDSGSGTGGTGPGAPDEFDGIDTTYAGVIAAVMVNESGQIVITDAGGETTVLERPRDPEKEDEYEDVKITDSQGNTWVVDKNGNVSQPPVASAPDAVTNADSVDFIVRFAASTQQQYGFDMKEPGNVGTYENAQIKDSEYWIAWKSVEVGRQDYVNAQIPGETNFPASVGFKSISGPTPVQPGVNANEKQLSVTGKVKDEVESVSAYVRVKEPGSEDENEIEVGRLNVKAYSKVKNTLIIVPVNKVSTPDGISIREAINNIYKQAVAEWDVIVDEVLNVDADLIAGIDQGESGMLASFPDKARRFNKEFKQSRNIDKDAYYLFLVEGSGSSRTGFMPFKRKYGYIFVDNLRGTRLETVIAHEIGHGAFRLRHTFSSEAFMAPERTTNNLMDYKGGTELKKYQWDYVHDPESMNGWLEDDEESAMSKGFKHYLFEILNQYWCAQDLGIESFDYYCFEKTEKRFATIDELPELNLVKGIGFNYKSPGIYSFSTKYTREYTPIDKRNEFWYGHVQGDNISFKGTAGTSLNIYFKNPDDRDKFISKVLTNPGNTWAFHYSKLTKSIPSLIANKDNETLLNTLLTLPKCGYEYLDETTRIELIDKILKEAYTLRSFGVDGIEEILILKLINEIKSDAIPKFVNKLQSIDWVELFNSLDGDQSDVLSDVLIRICNEYYQHVVPENIGHIAYQKLSVANFFSRYKIEQNGAQISIVLKTDAPAPSPGNISIVLSSSELILPPNNPFSVLTVNQSEGDIESKAKLPAIPLILFAKMVHNQESDRAFDQAMLVVDVASLFLGVGEIKLALKSPKIFGKAFRLLLGSADLAATASDIYCATDENSELCKEWQKWGPYIQLGLLSASAIDQLQHLLVKSDEVLSLVENYADFKNISSITDARFINKLDELGLDQATLGRLDSDLSNKDLADAFRQKPDLVDSWKKALDSGFPELWRQYPEFLSKLRNVWDYNFVNGTNAKLPNVLLEPTQLTKVSTETLQQLRNTFNSTVRADFLKTLGNNSNISSMLKKAGFTDAEVPSLVQRLQSGQGIPGYQVHHKIPLDFGGTNDFSNLILMKQTPYHSAFTSFQNSQIDIAVGQTQTLNFPRVTGSFYSPPYIE